MEKLSVREKELIRPKKLSEIDEPPFALSEGALKSISTI